MSLATSADLHLEFRLRILQSSTAGLNAALHSISTVTIHGITDLICPRPIDPPTNGHSQLVSRCDVKVSLLLPTRASKSMCLICAASQNLTLEPWTAASTNDWFALIFSRYAGDSNHLHSCHTYMRKLFKSFDATRPTAFDYFNYLRSGQVLSAKLHQSPFCRNWKPDMDAEECYQCKQTVSSLSRRRNSSVGDTEPGDR
jgi:hypothetical protein